MMRRSVPWRNVVAFFVIAAGPLALDLYTKHVVFTLLGYPNNASDWSRSWLNGWLTFRFYTSFNQGALWGMGQGWTSAFAALSVLAVLAICYWAFVHGAAANSWLMVSLALVLAGTLGNLYDRLGLHGYVDPRTGEPIRAVRDFLLFTFGTFHWPVFNIADVTLVFGAGMLVLHSFFPKLGAPEEPAQADGEDDDRRESSHAMVESAPPGEHA